MPFSAWKITKDGAIYPDWGTGNLKLDFSLTLSQMYPLHVCQPPTSPKYVDSFPRCITRLPPSSLSRVGRDLSNRLSYEVGVL